MTNCPACFAALLLPNIAVCVNCGHLNGQAFPTTVLCTAKVPALDTSVCAKGSGMVVVRDSGISLVVPKYMDWDYGEDSALAQARSRVLEGRTQTQ